MTSLEKMKNADIMIAFASEHASKGSFPSHKSDNESVSTLGASVAQGPIVAPFNQKLQ